MRLLKEQSEPFYEVPYEFDSEIVHDTQDNSEIVHLEKVYGVKASELLEKIEQMKSQVTELLEKLKISDQELKHQNLLF
ncbi:hypothetical protein Tco_1094282 [Tanacetum coccineum]|uniref:Uncharacterized protein n=1 Tax=Tanacetum coccineum TaxID=301880 RepID=A0ABQ5IGG9_9ASTR